MLNEAASERTPDVDPAMADWFNVERPQGKAAQRDALEEDSETDPDSEYEELRFDEEAGEWVEPMKLTTMGENSTDEAPSVSFVSTAIGKLLIFVSR